MIRLLPALLFFILCAFLTISLWVGDKDSSFDPSGASFPSMQALSVTKGKSELAHEGTRIVNLFASWCVPCIVELPVLQEANDTLKLPIIGVAWKDDISKLDKWLKTHGDPFDVIYDDASGAFGIEVGIRGIPETFVIDANNTILFHHRGPLVPSHLDDIKKVLK